MTKPQFTPQISLGNVLQILAFVVALAVGYAALQASTETNSDRIDGLADKDTDLEARLRVVEAATLRQGADFSNLSRSLDKIEAQQRENNRLLQELLARTVGRGRTMP